MTPQESALPLTVDVIDHEFAVRLVLDRDEPLMRSDAPNALGQTDVRREVIHIRGGGEQSDGCMRDTLLHEVLHACMAVAGMDTNEDLVYRLTPVLLYVIRENPALMRALLR